MNSKKKPLKGAMGYFRGCELPIRWTKNATVLWERFSLERNGTARTESVMFGISCESARGQPTKTKTNKNQKKCSKMATFNPPRLQKPNSTLNERI